MHCIAALVIGTIKGILLGVIDSISKIEGYLFYNMIFYR